VYYAIAPPDALAFVTVTRVNQRTEEMFHGRAWEETVYLVAAIEASTVPVRQNAAAAARIDALLEDGDLALPSGFGVMAMYCESAIRDTRPDPTDPAGRQWAIRGGHYRVWVTTGPIAGEETTFMQPGWVQPGWVQPL